MFAVFWCPRLVAGGYQKSPSLFKAPLSGIWNSELLTHLSMFVRLCFVSKNPLFFFFFVIFLTRRRNRWQISYPSSNGRICAEAVRRTVSLLSRLFISFWLISSFALLILFLALNVRTVDRLALEAAKPPLYPAVTFAPCWTRRMWGRLKACEIERSCTFIFVRAGVVLSLLVSKWVIFM